MTRRAWSVAALGGALLASVTARATAPAPAAAPDPDAPTVGAVLERSEAHVGDRLTLTVSAVGRAGVAVTLPAHLDLGKLEVLDREQAEHDLGDGRHSHRFILGVAAYEVGDVEVPPIAISYLNPRGEVREVKTGPLSLRIRSLVAPDEERPEVQPLRPARDALVEDQRAMTILRWLLIAAAGALAGALALAAIRRALARKREESAELAPPPPPEETALAKLRALRAGGNFALDGYRPFFFAVAEVLRAYLGARYGFDALELTTSELLDALRSRAPELAADGSDVVRFLADADLVKFARTGSTDAAARAAIDRAEAIVLATTPRPATPPPPPEAEAPPSVTASAHASAPAEALAVTVTPPSDPPKESSGG